MEYILLIHIYRSYIISQKPQLYIWERIENGYNYTWKFQRYYVVYQDNIYSYRTQIHFMIQNQSH